MANPVHIFYPIIIYIDNTIHCEYVNKFHSLQCWCHKFYHSKLTEIGSSVEICEHIPFSLFYDHSMLYQRRFTTSYLRVVFSYLLYMLWYENSIPDRRNTRRHSECFSIWEKGIHTSVYEFSFAFSLWSHTASTVRMSWKHMCGAHVKMCLKFKVPPYFIPFHKKMLVKCSFKW